jgi:putative spermidine/putrescine transport system permease protein
VSASIAAPRAERKRASTTLAASLLAVPPVAFLVAAFAVPMAIVFLLAVRGPEGFTLQHLVAFFAAPAGRTMVANTIAYGIGTGTICCVLGFPLGYVISRAGPRTQVALIVLTFLPLCTSVIIKGFAITLLLKSNGIVNSALMALGIIDAPVRLIFTEFALFVGSVNVFLPFAVLPVYAVLAERGRDLEDAAATLGCSPAFALLRIVLPLARPGLVAAFSIVAAQAMSAYVVPTLLIGDRFRVLSRGAYDAYILHDPVGASVAALVLLVTALAIVAVANRFLGTRQAVA